MLLMITKKFDEIYPEFTISFSVICNTCNEHKHLAFSKSEGDAMKEAKKHDKKFPEHQIEVGNFVGEFPSDWSRQEAN